MASSAPRRLGFRPKADAVVLSARFGSLPDFPQKVAPIFDLDNYSRPIDHWVEDAHSQLYPSCLDPYTPAAVPQRPPHHDGRYLRACLASNERLRLSMLWYYTHSILSEKELLLGLQEKADLAKECTGWEYVVIGILDINVYTRLATVGLPLGILPRGETLCAHTVTQPPGSVFLLPNMMEDWRFRQCPYVEHGGLVAYAGVPLRLQNEDGQCFALGSLCVASSTSESPLNKIQQSTLARLADWVVSDLIQCTRARRQRVRREMSDLLAKAQKEVDATDSEDPVYGILSTMYPAATVTLQPYKGGDVELDGLDAIPVSDIEEGIWEDVEFLDKFIANTNHKDLPRDRIVRLLMAQCESVSGSSLLVVASKDYRHVFDDIDSWYLQSCASMLTAVWQKRLLREAMRAKERFLRGFSHQLRTPLHVILSSVELLAEEMKTQSLRELSRTTPALLQLAQAVDNGGPNIYLDTIKAAGRDLISIVNNMITLNRWADIAAKERRYALHTTYELEAALADEITKTLSSDTRYSPTVFFHHSLSQTGSSLRVDLGLLRDSVLPLIINAIQNAPKGTVVVTFSTCCATKGLVIDVQDTGCGILPEDQERIFEPYERTEATETIGAGLGLSLASKFAALLHGSVELVSSQVGCGSHFRATYKGIEAVSSMLPSPQSQLSLGNLPLSFQCPSVSSSPVGLDLCTQFSKFLQSQGFSRSRDAGGFLHVLEYSSDSTQHNARIAKVPSGQVAICLVPASQADAAPPQSVDNVVYVTAPFFTPKMISALEEADQTFAALQASLKLSRQPDQDCGSSLTQSLEKCGLADVAPAADRDIDTPSAPIVDPKAAILGLVENKPHGNAPEAKQMATKPDAAEDMKSTTKNGGPIADRQLTSPDPVALLVDDNAVNLRILQMYCNKRKIEYYSAADGQQAVELYNKRQSLYATGQGNAISLIFMDLQMPVCDGIEATRQIRQLEQENEWPRSSLIIVTGQDGADDRVAADDAGADDYFVKPVSIKVLDVGVKRHFPNFKAV